MELLNDKVFNTENSIKLMDLIHTVFINYKKENYSFKNLISYIEFKNIIHKFIIEIMGLFLVDTKYSDDTYDVYIKKINNRIEGVFCSNDNSLVINENVVSNIYNGVFESFLAIFHELNHFKLKYDILMGVINLDTSRVIKEKLIMDDELSESPYNNSYYFNNYKLFSEEVLANINSKFDLITMMRLLLVKYNLYDELSEKACAQLFNNLIGDDYLDYENVIRDVSVSWNFNSNNIDFNEAFNILIKYHPEWLEYPQISIEYYIDEDNKVRKKSIEELGESLDKYSDADTKAYIKYLIKELDNKKIRGKHR